MIRSDFSSFGSAPKVARFVEKQLSNYYYTFPMALNVSTELQLNAS